jgi:hypothetical protein
LSEFGNLGKIGGFVYSLLIQGATTFNFLQNVVVSGIAELNNWKALFDSVKKVD